MDVSIIKRYFIKHEEINIHVTEWGDRNQPVIFCLHGLGSTSLSFIEIAEGLKDEFRVIAIDAPGHGKTEPFTKEEQYEMSAMANWLNHIIDVLEIEQFFFLSHSWGSFVSLFYLLDFPERVKGTILIDGGYQSKRLKGQSVEDEVAHYLSDFEGYVESWDQFLEEAVYGGVSRRSKLLDLAGKDLALKKDKRFYWHARGTTAASIVKAMHKDEIIDIYEQLPSTILLLRATQPKDQQPYRDKTSRLFEQKTGATVKEIQDTTHMLHWDKPVVVVNEIREMWS